MAGAGACELPDPAASAEGRRLFRELVALERRVGRGRTGREEVTHMRGMKDDAANAVCGALAMARRWNPNRPHMAPVVYGGSGPTTEHEFVPASDNYLPFAERVR